MILFITRKYPPSVGGMQELSYYVTTTIARRVPARIIKWGGSQTWLPLFVLYALVRALWTLATRQVTLIHIGDPVLAPLGLFLHLVSRQPVVVNAHGLDVIYPNRLYQAIVPACMKRLDLVICISEHTRQQCLTRGIEASRTKVIPVGVNVDAFKLSLTEEEQMHWMGRWGLTSHPDRILLTVGRLVPRKGVALFVSQVLPRMMERRDDWLYLIVGDGPERAAIDAAVRDQELDKVVRMLGRVPDDELQAAYAIADVFVMPNVPVEGNSEGFGIVTLEARASGLPVVASSLEGIGDSFTSEDDGILVPPGDVEAFVAAIDRLLEAKLTLKTRLRHRQQVESRYGWTRIAEEYLSAFRGVQIGYHSRNKQNDQG
jgi:phosphatidylinositol alpha-1,6-mannosyltransferase